ncbi:hypothetical protein J2S77_001168 [Alkalibacillus salilacus]|uniref:Copper amine oxidase-like N-terminal domain-containing protein n=2 Tax=Alkalibacillus salilacus TaxID=284582 RepID=A0ABT9VE08_9BACI|nr:hypothetical protein [Alkalibacillus salilacus]
MSIIVFLTVTSVLLGVYHWSSYQDSTSEKNLAIDETVRVTESNETLMIEHQMDSLPKMQIPLSVPSQADDLSCLEEECQIENGELNVESPGAYTLEYQISKTTIVPSVYYINDWLVKLDPEQRDQKSRNFRMTLSGKKQGQWHSIRPPVLDSERNNIHYYEWQFEDSVEPPLIKLKEPLNYQERLNRLNIISNEPISQKKLQTLQKTFNQSHDQLLIVNSNLEKVITDHLVIVSNLNNSTEKMFESYLQSVSTNVERDQQVIQTLTDLYYKQDVDHPRVNALTETLTNEEQSRLFQRLMDLEMHQGSLIQLLDELLSDLLGYQTQFFELNHASESFISLFGEETRPLYINGEQVDYDLKRKDEQVYMKMNDFISVFDLYGFSIDQRHEWFVESDEKEYRFYSNRSVYMIDHTRFQVDQSAWFETDESFYVSISLLSEIFNRTFEENSEEIRLE